MLVRVLVFITLTVFFAEQVLATGSHELAQVTVGGHSCMLVTNLPNMTATERAAAIRSRIAEVLNYKELDPAKMECRFGIDGTPVIAVGPLVIAEITDSDAEAFDKSKEALANKWLKILKPRLIQMKPLFARASHAKSKHASGLTDHSILLLVVEVGLLLLASLVLGELATKCGQPAIIGQILAGVLLGQTVLGSLLPDVSAALFPVDDVQLRLLQALSWIGVIFLIMLTGMETDLQVIKKMGKPAMYIGWVGLALPMMAGIGLSYLLPDSLLADPEKRLAFAVFLGTCFCVSSVPVVAKILIDMKVMRSRCGQLALASSLAHDLLSCLLLAVVASLAAGTEIGPDRLLSAPVGAAIFVVVVFLCRRLIYSLLRWVNEKLSSDKSLLTAIVVLLMGGAAITHLIGAHTVLGAFVVGMLIWQAPVVNERAIRPIHEMTMGVLAPIFFASSCLYVDLSTLLQPGLALITAVVCVVGMGSKIFACWLGARLSGLSNGEGLAAGIAADARGSMGLIVAMLGYSLGLITLDMLAIIVFLSLISTAVAPMGLKWALTKVPQTAEEEQQRLQHARLEGTMLGHIRRVLVPTGGKGPATMAIQFLNSLGRRQTLEIAVIGVGTAQSEVSESLARLSTHVDSKAVTIVNINKNSENPIEEILETARSGYDFIVMGAGPMDGPGLFGPIVDGVCSRSPLPVMIVRDPSAEANSVVRKILLPVSGTTDSLRAAELGIAMAWSFGASVVCLHISGLATADGESNETVAGPPLTTMGITDAVTSSLAALAEALKVDFKKALPEIAPSIAESILATAALEEVDLIVLGSAPRISDHLVLGDTISTVIRTASCAVAVVKL